MNYDLSEKFKILAITLNLKTTLYLHHVCNWVHFN